MKPIHFIKILIVLLALALGGYTIWFGTQSQFPTVIALPILFLGVVITFNAALNPKKIIDLFIEVSPEAHARYQYEQTLKHNQKVVDYAHIGLESSTTAKAIIEQLPIEKQKEYEKMVIELNTAIVFFEGLIKTADSYNLLPKKKSSFPVTLTILLITTLSLALTDNLNAQDYTNDRKEHSRLTLVLEAVPKANITTNYQLGILAPCWGNFVGITSQTSHYNNSGIVSRPFEIPATSGALNSNSIVTEKFLHITTGPRIPLGENEEVALHPFGDLLVGEGFYKFGYGLKAYYEPRRWISLGLAYQNESVFLSFMFHLDCESDRPRRMSKRTPGLFKW